MSIRVLGKRRRERTLLVEEYAAALPPGSPFGCQRSSRAAEPIGVRLSAQQHAATAARMHPGLDKKRISPHVLRHTGAMPPQATQDIRKKSLWLGAR